MSGFQSDKGMQPNLKEGVLALLENGKGQDISGSEMAERLHVSRNAIWKAIKQLKEEGYQIEAATNRGYCLHSDNNIVSAQGIYKYLTVDIPGIEVHKTTVSTNTILREKAEENSPEGTVVIAEEQTGGRGRMGRVFFSPAETGLYMSILLRPQLAVSEALNITTCAAVAVAEAIEMNTGIEAQIKWVNDIYCGNKKVCGILTEASFDMENMGINYAILGIGINVFQPRNAFPDEIRDVADALLNKEDNHEDFRNRLAAQVLNRFMKYYDNINDRKLLEEYKRRSLLLGREINILSKEGTQKATALDIDEQFRLKVLMQDGTTKFLSSGEVSVRSVT
ncbi:biotin--[acetyl-CoA-carboxylase] ligase [Parasporobacterium paucivorans]|uniref:Bifunctional ligase/repressor BirA n=1 Tax=Parasporobacterium paucivorans DSM 15970 TaxID=1122934 RepID=A0A1M6G1P2_9FIRM|nr:biotin--[acetyl-CoA-carboxylase] ligase [Parasporobacterium paucivorans]SHJ03829.1 BirA family transcriptional regulator, biotin operon repressor / biotin-[acetyl-CoA-carboxylase] ligase [Parasporobacterium paucivorans DSM 15970]